MASGVLVALIMPAAFSYQVLLRITLTQRFKLSTEQARIDVMKKYTVKTDYHVNLIRLQQLCEDNYLRIMNLIQDVERQQSFRFTVLDVSPAQWMIIDVLDRAPYTTLLRLKLDANWGDYLAMPHAEVRLYHDVCMAEVVFRKASQSLQPTYDYPNAKMHQPNEKEQHNYFLAQWLDYILTCCHASQVNIS